MIGHIKSSVHKSFEVKKDTHVALRQGEPSKFHDGLKRKADWLESSSRLTEAVIILRD